MRAVAASPSGHLLDIGSDRRDRVQPNLEVFIDQTRGLPADAGNIVGALLSGGLLHQLGPQRRQRPDEFFLLASLQCCNGSHDQLVDLGDQRLGIKPAVGTVGVIDEFGSGAQGIESCGRLIEQFAHIGGFCVVPTQPEDVVEPAGDLAGVGTGEGVIPHLPRKAWT